MVLGMRNVSDKNCRDNQNTRFVFNDFFFFKNRAIYEIMWKNTVEPVQATDKNVAHAHCMLDT